MENIIEKETVEEKIEDNHKWYVINTVIGQERKISKTISEDAEKKGISTLISDVIVPFEKVTEMKRGKKVDVERKVCPGYILIRMEINEKTLTLIRGINGVAKFLGKDKKPMPIPDREVQKMIDNLTAINVMNTSASKELGYSPGDVIEIKEGAFEGFTACVDMVDTERTKITVSVSIFGRETPVELDFTQAMRIQRE